MLNRQEEASRAGLQLEGRETQGRCGVSRSKKPGLEPWWNCWEELGLGREVLLGRDRSSLPSDPCVALPWFCSELQRG